MAEELGLDIKDITPGVGDSNYPPGAGSGGSNTAPSVCPTVKMAAVAVRNGLLPVAAKHPKLAVPPEQAVEMLDFVYPGKIQVKGNPAKSITFKEACALLPAEGLKVQGRDNPLLRQGGVAGACFAEVEVDTETGKVRCLKIVNLQDCGFVINRLQSETQIIGAVVQGIAQALLEHRQMDNLTGRMLNPNLEDYKLGHSLEMCEMVCEAFDNPTGRVSGVGEPPVIPVAPAIANAVLNAIGVRIAEAPITPDKVLRALAQRRGGMA
jgi:xanthine dehydrogenase YagR molybdenum-binding subunit